MSPTVLFAAPTVLTRRRSRLVQSVAALLLAAAAVLHADGTTEGDPTGTRAAVRADGVRVYLPLMIRRWPVTVCDEGVRETEAIERAIGEAMMYGLGPLPGEADPRVVAADRLTAAEYDVRFSARDEFDLLGPGHSPVPPPWACYWRVELAGEGRFVGGRAPGDPFPVNYSLSVAPAQDCSRCVGHFEIGWRDPATPTVEPIAEPTPLP